MSSRISTLRALAFGLCGLAWACQGNPGPMEVTNPGPRYGTTTIDGVQMLHTPPSHRLTPATTVSAVIGPEGGSIETDGGRLDIPAGALAVPMLIVEKGKEAPYYRYRFGPAGLQFATPATLTIQVDPAEVGVDPSRIKVAGSNDLGLEWTVIGGTYDPALGAVVVQIEHFSLYELCIN
jgi:hypothetical protein